MKEEYQLLDSGDGLKFERFGPYSLIRPASQAVWKPQLSKKEWDKSDALFTREESNQWVKPINQEWRLKIADITFRLNATDFGHLGVFPEQQDFWIWIQENTKPNMRVLNLFAYSGGSTLAAAKAGAQVTHLDSSKGMVAWARENAALNQLEKAPIRWIVDDAIKFIKREIKRENLYDAIILDPPSFGRGAQGEVFKIDEQVHNLLTLCTSLLTPEARYILFSCHTPGYTPLIMHNLLKQTAPQGKIDAGEMILKGNENVLPLPSGTFARWCST